MINRQALLVLLAMAASTQRLDAFVMPTVHTAGRHFFRVKTPYRSSLANEVEAEQAAIAEHHSQAVPEQHPESLVDKLIMDIPPLPTNRAEAVKPKPIVAKKAVAKKRGNPHKEGVFSPVVVAAGVIMGEEQLNKVRAKVISLHSDIIKSFVDTSDSAFGKAVLKQLFVLVDKDESGYLDREEVGLALNLLSFKWLGEKQVNKIFERADANGDEEISLEEFMDEAPKTLRVNLVKLAKTNGGEMGLLV